MRDQWESTFVRKGLLICEKKGAGSCGWYSQKLFFKIMNKPDDLTMKKSFTGSQKKLRQWSHIYKHNENFGCMRTYIPWYIGTKEKLSSKKKTF